MADIDLLRGVIRADSSPLDREMKKAVAITKASGGEMEKSFQKVSRDAQNVGQSLGKALAAIGTALFSKQIIDSVDRLNDLANQLGVSTEALSALDYAAKLSGTSLEAAAQGMKFLGNNVSDAAAGIGSAKETLKNLGLNAKELAAMPLDKQFDKVAEALSGITNQGDKIAYVRDLFGKMGVDLLPLINDFKELKEEAIAVGYVVSDETAQRFAMLNDEIDRFSLASQVLGRNLMEVLLPAITDTLAGVNELFAGVSNTSKLFNELGAGMIGVGSMMGLVDKDVADAAADIAAENIAIGQQRRSPRLRVTVPSTGSGRTSTAKTGKSDTSKQAEDYDNLTSSVDAYVRKQQMEYELLGLTEKQRAGMQAVYEVQNLAIKEGNLLTEEEITGIKGKAEAMYELKDSMDEAARFSKELKDGLSSALATIVFSTDKASDSMKRFAQAIAETIFQKKIAGPLSEGIIDSLDGGSLFKGIGSMFGGFFADGGSPPVGVPSIVGERGPEIFVPKSAGTVIPNGAMGGSTVNVYQNNTFTGGVTRQDFASAIPGMIAMTKQAVAAEIQRGGNFSKLVGKRA